jgi:hypothetical protein
MSSKSEGGVFDFLILDLILILILTRQEAEDEADEFYNNNKTCGRRWVGVPDDPN